MPKLRQVDPLIKARADTKVLKPKPKVADHVYRTAQYALWRGQVIARAGGRCQAIDQGSRCKNMEPRFRMYADHIHEIADGGDPFDVRNGQCLCAAHHTLKTTAARADRLSR